MAMTCAGTWKRWASTHHKSISITSCLIIARLVPARLRHIAPMGLIKWVWKTKSMRATSALKLNLCAVIYSIRVKWCVMILDAWLEWSFPVPSENVHELWRGSNPNPSRSRKDKANDCTVDSDKTSQESGHRYSRCGPGHAHEITCRQSPAPASGAADHRSCLPHRRASGSQADLCHCWPSSRRRADRCRKGTRSRSGKSGKLCQTNRTARNRRRRDGCARCAGGRELYYADSFRRRADDSRGDFADSAQGAYRRQSIMHDAFGSPGESHGLRTHHARRDRWLPENRRAKRCDRGGATDSRNKRRYLLL